MKQSTQLETRLSRRQSLAAAGTLALGAAFVRMPAGVHARQEATPTVDGGVELAPGVWAEVFAGLPSDRAPGQTVYLARFTFFPGGEIFPHGHPGTTMLSVERGTFGWTLIEGTAHVLRGAAAGATEPTEDMVEAGVEVILNPGDAIFYEDDVMHTAHCAGEDAAIVFGTLVLTTGEPLLMPMDDAMSH